MDVATKSLDSYKKQPSTTTEQFLTVWTDSMTQIKGLVEQGRTVQLRLF